jgi:hypothetical protein
LETASGTGRGGRGGGSAARRRRESRGGARTVGGRVVGHRDARVRSVASRRVGEWPERSGSAPRR